MRRLAPLPLLAPLLLLAVAVAGVAGAEPAAPARPLTPGDVVLRLDPGPRQAAPAGAAKPGAPAEVGAVCRVQPTGRLADCLVMEERPAGYGLGAWLVQTFSHASVGASARDGSPTAGRLFAFRTQVRSDAPVAAPVPKS